MTDRLATLDARFVDLEAQPTVAIRVRQSMAELDIGALFDRNLPRVFEQLGRLGATPTGAPFARYHEFGPDQADIEMGVPVAAPLGGLAPLADAAPEEIGTSALPGGRAAVLVHRGPYEALGEAYDRLRTWIREEGRKPGDAPWESYVDDPGAVADVAELRTEIYWPVA
jgi:effector-binding domain-containing protein